VAGDEATGIASAVEHLVQLGHRSIAHIAGPPDLSTGYVRERAFRESVRRYDLVASDCPSLTADAYSEAAGHAAVLSLLASSGHPTGIVASNDLLALGAVDGLQERGLTCPDDMSVVGFNDMPFLGRMSPALTTIRLPKREIGVQAARLLLERLTGSSEPDARCILLPCPLIVRQSTAPPPL
jgi:LacI family transcriptional regulator